MDFREHLAKSLSLDLAFVEGSFSQSLEAEKDDLELILLRVWKRPECECSTKVFSYSVY